MKPTDAWRVELRHADRDDTPRFSCGADATILEAARGVGIVLQAACERGGCGACRAVLIDGEARHREPVSQRARIHPDSGRPECILLCRAMPLGPVTVEPLIPWTLTRIKPLSDLVSCRA